MKAPLIAISRHRLSTDGAGVTTLVAFHGCPLRCRYCLNWQCWEPEHIWREVDVEELLSELMIDDLYFQATNGGVCFGGGEPLLHSTFIDRFCQRRPESWRIYMETSLSVPTRHLETIAPWVTHYYIDIKDMDPDIYRQYTGRDNTAMMANLHWLADHQLQQQVTIRLPLIPDFNNDAHRAHSMELLQSLGFTTFDRFDYLIK